MREGGASTPLEREEARELVGRVDSSSRDHSSESRVDCWEGC